MSNVSGVTFQIEELKTFPITLDIAVPPMKPLMRGQIKIEAVVKTKDEIKALADEQLDDVDYYDQVITGVSGIGRAGTKELMTPEEGKEFCRNGKLNTWMVPAIISAYFEQYGEARQKNSKTSSRR